MLGQRLDKWLWCARLTRTRVSAAALIAEGKVRVNGSRVSKLARLVKPGDVVTGTTGGRLFVVRVLGEAQRRGPASDACLLYEDLTPRPSIGEAAETPRAERTGPRPTKRDRRRLDAVRAGPGRQDG